MNTQNMATNEDLDMEEKVESYLARGTNINYRLDDQEIPESEVLQKAVSEILPSDNPLDSPDFNAIDYINSKFTDGMTCSISFSEVLLT